MREWSCRAELSRALWTQLFDCRDTAEYKIQSVEVVVSA